jgi:hypothetical protein
MSYERMKIENNKIVYKMMKAFVSSLPGKHGLRIFGGYARDMILKSHCTARYYQEGGYDSYFNRYNYEGVKSNSLLCPNDIDIFAYTEDFIEIEKILFETSRIALLKIKGRGNTRFGIEQENEMAFYFGKPIPNVFLRQYTIYSPYSKHTFNLDLVYTNNPDITPPFNRLDFEENGIYYCCDTQTYKISEYISKKYLGTHADITSELVVLSNLMQNIKNKVLTPAYEDAKTRQDYLNNTLYSYRLKKFERRGWEVNFPEVDEEVDEKHVNQAREQVDKELGDDSSDYEDTSDDSSDYEDTSDDSDEELK